MGGPWTIPSDNPFIRAHDWGRFLAVSYGEVDWPSKSYRLWVWSAEP